MKRKLEPWPFIAAALAIDAALLAFHAAGVIALPMWLLVAALAPWLVGVAFGAGLAAIVIANALADQKAGRE